jgi:uncharacterized protein with HEPN domain
MLESMQKILTYTEDMNYAEFTQNDLVRDAVIRNFEIIGEASKSIPNKIKNKYPKLPWKQMYGLRNLVTHEYFGVDDETLWTIISQQLSENMIQLQKVIQKETK